jgi:phosphatidylglycerophosphatase C
MSTPAINVYDFDHTIYDGDASLDFILYCLKRNPRTWKYLPAQGFALVKYAFGRATRKQIKQVAFAYLRDVPDANAALENFWSTHQKKIKQWYLDQKQPTDLIVSASPEFLLEPIARKLGIAKPIATRMDIRTGQITGENCRAEEKVTRIHDYDPSIKIANCYSDSMSDMPLLRLADNGFMVKKHTVTPLDRTDMSKN